MVKITSKEIGQEGDEIAATQRRYALPRIPKKPNGSADVLGFSILGNDDEQDFNLFSNNELSPEQAKSLLSSLAEGISWMNLAIFSVGTLTTAKDLKGDFARRIKDVAPEAADSAAKSVVSEGTEVTAKAASGFFKNALNGLAVVAKFAKKIPIVGMVVTSGFVAYEVSSFIAQGDTKNAFAAAAAGSGEIAGNFIGFGVGDATREALRGTFVAVGGEGYQQVAKSDIRALTELGQDLYNQFETAAANPNTPAYREAAPAMALTHG